MPLNFLSVFKKTNNCFSHHLTKVKLCFMEMNRKYIKLIQILNRLILKLQNDNGNSMFDLSHMLRRGSWVLKHSHINNKRNAK